MEELYRKALADGLGDAVEDARRGNVAARTYLQFRYAAVLDQAAERKAERRAERQAEYTAEAGHDGFQYIA